MSWGQPPGPPGGSPPGPPGAGGFGAPPGGPPTPAFGGFGASPPGGPAGPPAGGDGGLAQVPFSQADLGNIKTMSTLMMAAAGLMVSGQVLGIVASIAWAIAGIGSNQGSSSGSSGVTQGMVGLALTVVMAALLFLGAQAFRKVVDTDDADQKHLEVGLGHLRSYFVVKGVAYLLGILVSCCLCAGGILFFGAIMALIGAIAGAQ